MRLVRRPRIRAECLIEQNRIAKNEFRVNHAASIREA